MKNHLFFIVLLVTTCLACSQKKQRKLGLHDIQIGDVLLSASPMRGRADSTASVPASPLLYFRVRIEKDMKKKIEKEQLLYLDFDMQQDFVLHSGSRAIPAGFCQKIENGISNNYEYIVAFEAAPETIQNDLTLVYTDKIFGAGVVAFQYQPNEFKTSPKSSAP